MSESTQLTVQTISIDENHASQRIDNYLMTKLKGVPKSRIYRIIRKGEVRVNKKRIKPEYKLQTNDLVRIPPVRIASRGETPPPSTQLQKVLEEAIIFQDEAMLIINKPSGIAVHAGTGVKIGLIEALRYMYPQKPELELVHRLDKGTSGCIMIAKNKSVLRALSEALKQRRVKKTYHAVVEGSWPKKNIVVDQPLLKLQPRSGERFVEVSAEGKAATTHFKLLKTGPFHSLIEAQPITGRTHQIRVHAQYLGHPISGDDKYFFDKSPQLVKRLGIKRLCLHSASLSFHHPTNQQLMSISADYDEALAKTIGAF